jgi:hypothetical protein
VVRLTAEVIDKLSAWLQDLIGWVYGSALLAASRRPAQRVWQPIAGKPMRACDLQPALPATCSFVATASEDRRPFFGIPGRRKYVYPRPLLSRRRRRGRLRAPDRGEKLACDLSERRPKFLDCTIGILSENCSSVRNQGHMVKIALTLPTHGLARDLKGRCSCLLSAAISVSKRSTT